MLYRCLYQGVRNVISWENLANLLNEWSLSDCRSIFKVLQISVDLAYFEIRAWNEIQKVKDIWEVPHIKRAVGN